MDGAKRKHDEEQGGGGGTKRKHDKKQQKPKTKQQTTQGGDVFYNVELLRQLKNYLTQQQATVFHDLLQFRKPLAPETITSLKILRSMMLGRKREELRNYTDIAKTIIYLLIDEQGNPSGTNVQIYHKNMITGENSYGIVFSYDHNERGILNFKIYLGFFEEDEYIYHSLTEFFTVLVHVLEAFVRKTPTNYHNFVTFSGQSRIVPLINDLPLQPISSGHNLPRLPLSRTFFVRYVFEKYEQRATNPDIVNNRPRYLLRPISLSVELPTPQNISIILREIDRHRFQQQRIRQ